jgi:SAM-dependent methyltransferase
MQRSFWKPLEAFEGPTPAVGYAHRLASQQLAWWKQILDVQRPYRRFLRSLHPGRTLDLGCGIGRTLAWLPPGSVGVDRDAAAIAIATGRGLTAFTPDQFQSSGLASSGGFDTLLLAHVAEHVRAEELDSLVRTYLEYVRRGGSFVAITPQERGFRSDPTHVRFVDDGALRRLALRLGLEHGWTRSFPFSRWAGRVFTYNEFVLVARKPV